MELDFGIIDSGEAVPLWLSPQMAVESQYTQQVVPVNSKATFHTPFITGQIEAVSGYAIPVRPEVLRGGIPPVITCPLRPPLQYDIDTGNCARSAGYPLPPCPDQAPPQ